jgi:hypothetical protein
MSAAPNFWETLSKSLLRSAKSRGAMAFIPWLLIGTTTIPAVLEWYFCVPAYASRPEALTIISAMLTTAGFLGALTIFSMGHVMSVCLSYPFSLYLAKEDLFDEFIFFPQLVLLIQILFIVICTLLVFFIELLGRFGDYALVVSGGFFIYISIKTWSLVDLMRTMSWHYAEFQHIYNTD